MCFSVRVNMSQWELSSHHTGTSYYSPAPHRALLVDDGGSQKGEMRFHSKERNNLYRLPSRKDVHKCMSPQFRQADRPKTTTKTSEGLDMKDKGKQNDFSHSISSREGE